MDSGVAATSNQVKSKNTDMLDICVVWAMTACCFCCTLLVFISMFYLNVCCLYCLSMFSCLCQLLDLESVK